jgi:hypothetical protein
MRGSAVVPVLVFTLGLQGAQVPAAFQNSPGVEQVLRARVTSYWEARSKSNLVAAHAFYEPAFRTEYPLDLFLSNFQRLLRFRPEFLGIDRITVEPDGRSAQVVVRLRVRPAELNGEVLDTPSPETWLLLDGVWYRQREAMLPSI